MAKENHRKTTDPAYVFDNMGKEAQACAAAMVAYCIQHGCCMGQDEGLLADGKPRRFRKQLEAFAATIKRPGTL